MSQTGAKANHTYPISRAEKINYWYRLNPSSSGDFSGTTGNNPAMGQEELKPSQVSQDRVFLSVLVAAPSVITVQVGEHKPTTLHARMPGINHLSVPFNGQTGQVRMGVTRGQCEIISAVGPEITNNCSDGMVDWNAIVGSSEENTNK